MNKLIALTVIFLFYTFSAYAEEALTWGDCLSEAAKNNPDLISAQENIKQNEAAKKITASSLYPQVTGSVSASTSKTGTTSGTSTTTSTSDSYSYGLSGTQLIFDGFKTANNVNAAGENIKSSVEGYKFSSSQVRQSLKTAFINLLQAQELVKVARDIIRIRRSNLELITLRYESGLEHKGALLTAEANMAQANFDLAQAKRSIGLAQWQLTKAMGRKSFIPMSVNADFTVSDAVREKPDFTLIAENTPSVKQLIARKNSALFGIKSAYGNFSPKITGQAGAEKSDSHWLPQNNQWNLGLGVSMPIFEGGLRHAQLAQARALYNQAEANERSTRDGVIVSLSQAWTALENTVDNVEVQAKILLANQERSNIAEAQYSTGFITFDNWIIIENDLVKAKKDYLTAQANAATAEANWIQAKGETLEYAQ